MLVEKIKKLCNARGISVPKLEDALGFGAGTISKWKKSVPAFDKVEKVAEYFQVSISYFSKNGDGNALCSTRIPVLGKVVAGVPIEATEDILGYEDITEHMARTGEYFALRVNGDSMLPEIKNGDTVIVKKQNSVNNGDTAIVLINGNEATCKKIKITDSGITLIGYNLSVYEPHFYTNEEIESLPISIIGKVIELRRKF